MKEKIVLQNLNVSFENKPILKGVNLSIQENEIISIIGPAHSGKTTLLRTINRLIENQPGFVRTGSLLLEGKDVWQWEINTLRRYVGLIFVTPVPLPGIIFDNIAYGPRIHGINSRTTLEEIVERTLRAVGMWDDLKDQLNRNALTLTDEQRQHLCIARLLAVEPEVLLLDEPCSALDPIATLHIEDLLRQLKEKYTIVIVTHNMQQAARVSDFTGFMLLGKLIEFGTTSQIFTRPRKSDTENYISGKFG